MPAFGVRALADEAGKVCATRGSEGSVDAAHVANEDAGALIMALVSKKDSVWATNGDTPGRDIAMRDSSSRRCLSMTMVPCYVGTAVVARVCTLC